VQRFRAAKQYIVFATEAELPYNFFNSKKLARQNISIFSDLCQNQVRNRIIIKND
jgi:hypothetical protein